MRIKYFIYFLSVTAFLFISSCASDDKNKEFQEEKSSNKYKEEKLQNSDSVHQEDTNKYTESQLQEQKKELEKYDPRKPVAVISPLEAANYHGKTVTIKGFVADVYKNDKVAYLNFVQKYPDNPFTAVIFARKFGDFPDVNKYMNKDVEVTGVVSKFKGKPQIIITEKWQLKLQQP